MQTIEFAHQSELTIADNFHITFIQKKPNIWFRFWYRALLGWKWKNL